MSGPASLRYGGWAAERPGRFLGLPASGWAVVVAGLLPVLAAAAAHRLALAALLLPAWAAVSGLVAVPVRGRPAARWCADLLLCALGRAAGWTDWQSDAAAGRAADPDQADLPGVLSGIRTHDGPPYGPGLGRPVLVADARARTWAVVARLEHPGIGLAEPAARARLGAGLAELLEDVAGSGLPSLISLQVRTVSDDGAERNRWQRARLRPDAPALSRAVTADLAAVLPSVAVRSETFLTLVVPDARLARPAREAGGGADGRARVLHGLMGQVERRLPGALGVTAVDWLDAAGLAAAIRTGFAPGDRPGSAGDPAGLGEATGGGRPWPMAAAGPSAAPPPERRWYGHDAWRTATCTLLLPDRGAVMGALAPVLSPTVAGERRSMTVFYEPVGAATADRLVGAEAMSADLAAELRRRGGFRTRATHNRDDARIAGQDARLAEGSALLRVAAAVAVTVPDTWPIADFARRLEAAITEAGFAPLRLDLAQDSGFAAACVPLGVGLPRRRGLR